MKTLFLALALAVMSLAAPQAAALDQADLRACNKLAEKAKSLGGEVNSLKSERDELAGEAERAGERWEEAETHSDVSVRHAQAADEARADWQAAKEAVYGAEATLQARVAALNETAATFNSRCAAR